MDFFSHQDKARTSSFTILVLFVVVITVLFFAVAFTVSILNNYLSLERDLWSLTKTGLFVAGMFWFAIAAGCFFRWLDIRGGSSCLAKRFGATEIDTATRNDSKKQLLAVTAEMAIAASVPEPTVWVMPHEQSINAFVLGSTNDTAIVVTQAALDELTRDDMRALVGHELGHVVQGDLAINMRLLMVLSGMMALTEIGDTFGENFAGTIFRTVGSVCVFCGTLIRSAFSRRREYLADAMAVQFTRDPAAVANCLHTISVHNISAHQDKQALSSRFRHELAHLCFHVPNRKKWLAAKLATHPPLKKRIARIDPNFQPRIAARKRAEDRRESNNISNAMQSGGNRSAGAGVSSFQEASPLDDLLTLYLSDPQDALAGIFTLFLTGHSGQRQSFLNSLAFIFRKPFAEKVEQMDKSYGEQLRTQPLRVIDIAGHKLLDKLDIEQRRTMLHHLESLIAIEEESTLMNHAGIALLRRRLEADHPVLKKPAGTTANAPKPPEIQDNDIGLLLSLLIEASGNTNQRNLAEYQRVMKTYTSEVVPYTQRDQPGVVKRMQRAFEIMSVQPQMVRDTFIQHCAEVIMHDHVITDDEMLLIQLFAESLDAKKPTFESANGGGSHLRKAS